MTDVNIKDEAQKLVRGIASALKISSSSLCFCGTGKQYGECCENVSTEELIAAQEEFEAALNYRDAQGGRITTVPAGLFNRFLQKGINKLPCLYPNCAAKPVSCHHIPKNVLRAAFGSYCLDYRVWDGSNQCNFIKTSVSIAGTLPVFCAKHDNELFSEIDTFGSIVSPKQQFLLALKAAAFSLRRTQIFLSLDSQVEIFRPVLMIRSATNKQQYKININHLSEQYQRFRISHGTFQCFVKTLEGKDWDLFGYLQRNIPYNNNLLYAGVINPSHDLRKQRINTPHIPVQMTLNVFARDGVLRAFFACANDGSGEAYKALLEQLEMADDQTFIAVINTILTDQPKTLLLPEAFSLSGDDYIKMKALREYSKKCLASSSSDVFDLANTSQAVQFV